MPEVTEAPVYRPKTTNLEINGRTVLVVGTDLVSKKFLALVKVILDHVAGDLDLGLNSIVLDEDDLAVTLGDDGKTKSILADTYFAGGCVVINLMDTFDKSIGLSTDFDNVSIYPIFWHNLLLNVVHEAYHLRQRAEAADPKTWINRLMTDKPFAKEVEVECRENADRLLDEVVQTYDCEPPAYGEERFFANNVTALYSGEDGADEKAIKWLNDRVMVLTKDPDTGDPLPIQDFRGFMALNSDTPEDEAWNQPLKPVLDTVAPVENGFQANLNAVTKPAEEAAHEEAAVDVEYEEVPEGPWAEEDSTEGVIFAGAQFGAFNMAPADPMPSIPTNAPQATADPAAAQPTLQTGFAVPTQQPAPGPAIADAVAGSFGFGPQGAAPQMETATQTTPTVEVYPNHGLAPEKIRELFFSVASKCFTHVFTHCQPQGGGQPHENIVGFLKPDAVATIPVILSEEEKMVVVKCECVNAMGQRREAKLTSDGEVRGWVTPDAKVPMYKLFINFNGQELIRTLVPQNPNKRNAQGVLSQTASNARQGTAIMYAFEGNDTLKQANPAASLKAKCVNAQWSIING
jgi:hypothetical protein